jgi:dolichol-phosphate mannosyltransferase
MVGFRQLQIPYHRVFRHGSGPRRVSVRVAVMRALDLVISESAAPLRFVAALGIVACLLNLLYLVYILAVTLIKRRLAEGWLTTSVTQTVMFLLLFFILAVLAEYVARILDETKDRPLYFVEYEMKSSVTAPVIGTREPERLNVV